MLITLASDEFLDIAGAVLRRGGPLRFRATGMSMSPFIRSGDVLLAEPADAAGFRPGDVVLCRSPAGPCVHRITGMAKGTIRAQGDAPGCPVEEIPASDVLGLVQVLEREGRRILLDRGAPRLMRTPLARIPGVRRLLRTAGECWLWLDERRNRDGTDLMRIVHLCCPLVDPDTIHALSESRWARLVSVATDHDLAPLLHYQMSRSGVDLPPESARLLREAYYSSAARYAILSQGVAAVLAAMKDAGVRVMILKGVDLAETVYPSPACRPMTDVDLLIHHGDLTVADRALSGLAYRSVDGCAAEIDLSVPTSLATLDYRAPDPLLPPIHLHWHLVNTSVPADAYRDHISMDEIWSEALSSELNGTDVLRMAPHHLLVYLCEHALRPAHALSKPIQVTDLAWVIAATGQDLDWNRVLDAARRFRLGRMVYPALFVLRDWTGAPIPEATLASLRPTRLSGGERLFLRGVLKGCARPGISYFVHLALRRSVMEKVRFLAGTLFPSRPIVAHHTSGGAWAWYLRRGIEVIRHGLGRN